MLDQAVEVLLLVLYLYLVVVRAVVMILFVLAEAVDQEAADTLVVLEPLDKETQEPQHAHLQMVVAQEAVVKAALA
jgi:hypothetical protein